MTADPDDRCHVCDDLGEVREIDCGGEVVYERCYWCAASEPREDDRA